MSHCIYAIVVRTKDLSSVQVEHFRKTTHADFMIISSGAAVVNNLQLNMPRVQLSTDYFGGSGEQEATFFDEKGPCMSFGDRTRGGAINAALKMLGVPPSETCDLFDVLGLGGFRSEQDLSAPTVTLTLEQHKELLATLEDLKNWRSIVRLKAGKEIPFTDFTEKDMEEMERLAGGALTIARKGILSAEE